MIAEKIHFLKQEYLRLLEKTDPETKAAWGKMNFQQMLEHMSDSFRIANGKDPHRLYTPVEAVEKYKAFAMSDKPFKENTKNALLADEPALLRNAKPEQALTELQLEINDFFNVFESEPGKTITNPIFGDLNFKEWIQLLHKHAIHHLKQFGINT